jgi:hypothetical protein
MTAISVSIAVRAAGIATVPVAVAVRAERPKVSDLSQESPAWSPSAGARHRSAPPMSMIACKSKTTSQAPRRRVALKILPGPAAGDRVVSRSGWATFAAPLLRASVGSTKASASLPARVGVSDRRAQNHCCLGY